MKTFVKVIALTLSVMMMVFLFSGCKSGNGKTSSNSTAKANSVDFWGWGNSDYFQNYYNQFSIDEPEYSLVHDVGELNFQDLMSSIAAGNPPDLVYLDAAFFQQLAYNNLIEPMNKYYQEDTKFDINKLDKTVIDIGSKDGNFLMWGDYNGQVLYWNKEQFAEVGLNPEMPPRTWSELLSYATKLCKYDSTGYLIRIGFWDGLTLEREFLNSFGKDWVNEDGTKITINSADSKKTFDFALNFSKKEFGGRDKIPADVEWSFSNDNISMFIGDINVMPCVVAKLDSKWGMTYIPAPDDYKGQQKMGIRSLKGFLIPKGAKNPKGAWAFIRWFFQKGIVMGEKVKFDEKPEKFVPYVNTYKDSSDEVDSLYTSKVTDEGALSLIKQRNELVKNTFALNQPISKSVFDEIFQKYEASILDGTVTINDGLDQMQSALDQKISDWLNEQKK